MTTNQKIECSREARLWLGKIFTFIIIWESFPGLRLAIERGVNNLRFKVNNLITKIKSKFKKG